MKSFLLSVLLFLSACSWHSPDATFYTMNSEGLTEISSKKMLVAVKKVRVPDLLNKQQIVTYKSSSNEIEILEFSRWGENLPFVLQNVITNDLMLLLPNSFIKSSKLEGNNLSYNIEVEINKIEAYPNDKVKIYAWWNIYDKNGLILKRKQSLYEHKVAGSSISELVEAQNQAMHLLSKDIAETLSKF